MPFMDACVWVLDNLKRCTHLSVMKCDCAALTMLYMGHIGQIYSELPQQLLQVECGFWVCPWMNICVYFCSWVALCIYRSIMVCWPLVIWLSMYIYMQQSIMSIVTLATHLHWTCVVPCKWLQAIEAQSWLFDITAASLDVCCLLLVEEECTATQPRHLENINDMQAE